MWQLLAQEEKKMSQSEQIHFPVLAVLPVPINEYQHCAENNVSSRNQHEC